MGLDQNPKRQEAKTYIPTSQNIRQRKKHWVKRESETEPKHEEEEEEEEDGMKKKKE